MEARSWAWMLMIPLAIIGSALNLLDTNQVPLGFSLLATYAAFFFLFGFAESPDARPPKILPRSHTARTGLMPLGIMTVIMTVHLLSGSRTLSDYITPNYLAALVFVTLMWLLGAFAARRQDAHQVRPEASYDVFLRDCRKTKESPDAGESVYDYSEEPLTDMNHDTAPDKEGATDS